MNIVLVIIAGLALGSFVNVLISRLKIKEDGRNEIDFFGRSKCGECGKQIAWYDNIPLVSYLVLGGKCRSCGEKIPTYIPLVELFSAVYALGLYTYFGLSGKGLFGLLFGLLLLAIFVYDLKENLIPDYFVFAAGGLALVYQIYRLALGKVSWTSVVWGVVVGGGLFYLLYFFSSGKWLGFGDVKLGLVLGLALGWPLIGVNLWLAFVIGGIVGSLLIFAHRKKIRNKIAFAPFLVIGFYLSFFWGWQLINVYYNYLNL